MALETWRARLAAAGVSARGASHHALAELERALGASLPDALRELLGHANGFFLHRGSGFRLDATVDIADRAQDDLFVDAFPSMVCIGDDNGQGSYLIALGGAAFPLGTVILVDRGSLENETSVLAGHDVLEVVEATLAGEDLWSRPRLQSAPKKPPTWDAYVGCKVVFRAGALASWLKTKATLPTSSAQLLGAITQGTAKLGVETCIQRLQRSLTATFDGDTFALYGLVRKKSYWNAARDIAAIMNASAAHRASGFALIYNGGSSITAEEAVCLRVDDGVLAIEGFDESAARLIDERDAILDAAMMAASMRAHR